MDIWVTGTLNQQFRRGSYTQIKFSQSQYSQVKSSTPVFQKRFSFSENLFQGFKIVLNSFEKVRSWQEFILTNSCTELSFSL